MVAGIIDKLAFFCEGPSGYFYLTRFFQALGLFKIYRGDTKVEKNRQEMSSSSTLATFNLSPIVQTFLATSTMLWAHLLNRLIS